MENELLKKFTKKELEELSKIYYEEIRAIFRERPDEAKDRLGEIFIERGKLKVLGNSNIMNFRATIKAIELEIHNRGRDYHMIKKLQGDEIYRTWSIKFGDGTVFKKGDLDDFDEDLL